MKQESIKRLIAAGVFGCFLAASAGAQTAPDAMVDADGNLVINPGTPDEIMIAPPAGEVDGDGNLVIDGVTIDRPVATVLADGSLDLGDGTILQVPDLPADDAVSIVFGDLLAGLEDGWLWNYNFKTIYPYEGTNFVFFERLGSIFHLNTDRGHFSNGLWMYGFNFPEAGNNTWVYSSLAQMPDLRDGGGSTSAKQAQGFLYVYNEGGESSEWVFWAEGSQLNRSYVFDIDTGDFIQVWPRD